MSRSTRVSGSPKGASPGVSEIIYFLLYNPTITLKEDRAEENILYFYPPQTHTLNEMMNTAGLAMSFSNLMEKFDSSSPVRGFTTHRSYTAYWNPESAYYFILTTRRTEQSKLDTAHEHLESLLQAIYRQFVLHFGTMEGVLSQCGADGLRKLMTAYLTHACTYLLEPCTRGVVPTLVASLPHLEYYHPSQGHHPFLASFALVHRLYDIAGSALANQVVLIQGSLLYSDLPRNSDIRNLMHWLCGWVMLQPGSHPPTKNTSSTDEAIAPVVYPVVVPGNKNSKNKGALKGMARIAPTVAAGGAAASQYVTYEKLIPIFLHVCTHDKRDGGGVGIATPAEKEEEKAAGACSSSSTVCSCMETTPQRPQRCYALVFVYRSVTHILILRRPEAVASLEQELFDFIEESYASNMAPYLPGEGGASTTNISPSTSSSSASDPPPSIDLGAFGTVTFGATRAPSTVTLYPHLHSSISPVASEHAFFLLYYNVLTYTFQRHVSYGLLRQRYLSFLPACVRPFNVACARLTRWDFPGGMVRYHERQAAVIMRNTCRAQPSTYVPQDPSELHPVPYKAEIVWKLTDTLCLVARRLDQRIFLALVNVPPPSSKAASSSSTSGNTTTNHPRQGRQSESSTATNPSHSAAKKGVPVLTDRTAIEAMCIFNEACLKCCHGIIVQ